MTRRPGRRGRPGPPELPTAEGQLLVALRAGAAEAPGAGPDPGSGDGGLTRWVEMLFGPAARPPAELQRAAESLVEAGWVEEKASGEVGEGGLRLLPAGLPAAEAAFAAHADRRFGELLAASWESRAYRRLCRQAHGLDLGQTSLFDPVHRAAVEEALALKAGDRCLDAGCGSAGIALHLAETTGARVVGLDRSPRALAVARRRLDASPGASLEPRVTLLAADLAAPGALPVTDYTGLLAVDSLYFLPDPGAALDRLLDGLRPASDTAGARAAILATELLEAPGPQLDITQLDSDALAARTPIGRCLARRAGRGDGLTWQVTDLTPREVLHWERQAALLPELEEAFAAEGNGDLHRTLTLETERGLALARAGRLRRFLYRVRKG